MDSLLCDELLHEIIQRLPPSSFPAISLVSKRWLSALRSCITKLSISIPYSSPPLLSTILSHYPNLSSLAILFNPFDEDFDFYHDHLLKKPLSPSTSPARVCSSSDALLISAAAAPCASRLVDFRFSSASSPISSSALLSFSNSLRNLTSLHLSSVFPPSFHWLSCFPSIKSLSFVFSPKSPTEGEQAVDSSEEDNINNPSIVMLPLETLSVSGVRSCDKAMSWIWRRCGNLRWLKLRACEGTGDGPSSPFFPLCLAGLLVLELRACRAIADRVLLRASDHCNALTSLILHDGSSSNALHHFISRRAATLHTIDLRLPLDLHNVHLFAIASVAGFNSPRLSTLRLQSCCLLTGNGLRAVARAAACKAIEELALVNCDVIEREPGLLSFLGQSFPRLQRLDLSYNETLGDKELIAMLSSCAGLVEIKLRGCRCLTDSVLRGLIAGGCLRLEVADLCRCPWISLVGIEIFVMNSLKLSRLCVEKEKISEATMDMASRRAIYIGD